MNLINPANGKFKITLSQQLDIDGLFIIRDEILNEHLLYKQFIKSWKKVAGSDCNISTTSNEEINLIVIKHYNENKEKIKNEILPVLDLWEKNKVNFLEMCDNLFLNKNFHKNVTWVIYPTLWDISIQNIQKKSVSFAKSGTPEESLYVIMHEVLHVFFYEYLHYFHKDIVNNLSRKKLWDLAEIFNLVILNTAQFKQFYNNYTPIPYPEHGKIVNKISNKITKEIKADLIIKMIKLHIK